VVGAEGLEPPTCWM